MKIGILGVGAIGNLMASLLIAGDYELLFFNRRKLERLRIRSEEHITDLPIETVTEPVNKELDWLIICLKEYHYQRAMVWFTKLIGKSTKVAVIRNGLNHKIPLLDFANDQQLLECIIDCPVQLDSKGYFQLKKPKIICSAGKLGNSFSSLFKKDQITIVQSLDFKTEAWKKVCQSSALGGLLCVERDTCRIFKDEKNVIKFINLLEECISVARADGAKIEPDFVQLKVKELRHYPPSKGSSMLSDLLANKPIELGAKNGLISKMGQKYSLSTPLNDDIVKILRSESFNGFLL